MSSPIKPSGRHRIPRRQVLWGLSIAAASAIGCPGAAFGQVPSVLSGGAPVQIVPYVTEPGVPAFALIPGTANPFVGADGLAGGVSSGTDPATGLYFGSGGTGTGSVASSYSQYLGEAVGSGQCVALLQAADPGVGLTATWTPGAQVMGDTNLAPGTSIATFNSAGKYANATDGSSHAAIYLGQNSQGIQVMDQWLTQPASYRTIAWNNPGKTAANTGSQFYVVSH